MDHKPETQLAYDSLLETYTPLDIKDIITNGASRKAIHHKDKDDILSWYADYNEGLHHNLLDSDESIVNQYLLCRNVTTCQTGHMMTNTISSET